MRETASAARLDLLERDAELAAIEGLVGRQRPPAAGCWRSRGRRDRQDRADRRGESAGAARPGCRCSAARGSELERSFSYGVVRQLFEPLLASLPAEERAELLAGAAALADAALRPGAARRRAGADSSLGDAARPLLAGGERRRAAGRSCSRSTTSTGAICRRCAGSPTCCRAWRASPSRSSSASGRPRPARIRPAEPDRRRPAATVIRPAPLSLEAAARFVRETLSPDADDALLRRLPGGDRRQSAAPARARARDRRRGAVPDGGERAPTCASSRRVPGSRAVSLRLARLPPEATALAKAVAILGDDADPRQAAALADLDERGSLRRGRGALVRVDVLRPQQPLGFVHPLIRAAVYDSLTQLERDGGHERAAALLAAAGAEPERVAAQLLRSPPAGRRESWRRCARPPAVRARAGLPRARSPICAEPSTSRRMRPNAPTCWSSSARPRRGQRRGGGRASAGCAGADRRSAQESRDRAPARPPALPPPRRGVGRGPHPRRWTTSTAPTPSSSACSRPG